MFMSDSKCKSALIVKFFSGLLGVQSCPFKIGV